MTPVSLNSCFGLQVSVILFQHCKKNKNSYEVIKIKKKMFLIY